MRSVRKFIACDSGAITIDWVTITAGILVLGIIAVFTIFKTGVSDLVSGVNAVPESAAFDIAIDTSNPLSN